MAHKTSTYCLSDSAERPWGMWSVIGIGAGFVVKQITVKPGGRLSLQRHKMRDEHWVVVSGIAEAVIDGAPRRIAENEAAFIKAGSIHRLSNTGLTDLVLVEIQYGDTLDEADIERLEDVYGRMDGMANVAEGDI